MSCAVPFNTESEPAGDVVLVGASAKAELVELARAANRLVVELGRPGPAQRGRLGLFMEDAIEQALDAHGASPPGVGASSNLDASLSDQLFRVRLVKKSGLTLAFSSLDGIANLAGALDAEDSAVLRWWMRATRERPVQILLEWRDRFLGIYAAPTSLEALVEHGPEWVPPPDSAAHGSEPPAASAELAASLAAMQLSALGAPEPAAPAEALDTLTSEPVAAEALDAPTSEPASAEPLDALTSEPASAGPFDVLASEPAAEAFDALTSEPAAEVFDALTSEPIVVESEPPPSDGEPSDDVVRADEDTPSPSLADAMERALADDGVDEIPSSDPASTEPREHLQLLPPPLLTPPASAAVPAEDDAAPLLQVVNVDHDAVRTVDMTWPPERKKVAGRRMRSSVATQKPPEVAPRPTVEAAPTPPRTQRAPSAEECSALIRELEAARGPKPLAVIERLFVSAYVPLSEAVSAGLSDPRARAALDTWAKSFDKSYRDAFDALRLRGKRPTMVLDVPDVALRIGRLHGARSTQLVMVDAMRFDLGLRVQDRLREMLGQQAALTERLLLWSALPSTTLTQLELIGRGPAGLREMTGGADSEPPVARGRAAASLRRIRAGNREVYKLDLVESRLAEPGPALAERLDVLAEETASALASHITRLPPRTLVMTFGDHGFTVDEQDGGTSAARQGGASPEQVLVPAFAWIVGPVH